jgi:signal recognition particle receptor subunit beta
VQTDRGKVLSFINFAAREINCKIVYYGAGLGGKTTNLQVIFDKTAEKQKGKMISLATETDRTLFFDFLPLDLGTVKGFKTRFHLYTVPGQVFYDASRKLILRGVDGVVFVAGQPQRTRLRFRQDPIRSAAQQARPAECLACRYSEEGTAKAQRARV